MSLLKSTSRNKNKFLIVGNGRWSNVYRASLDKLGLQYADIPLSAFANTQSFMQLLPNVPITGSVFIVATHPDVQSSLYKFFTKNNYPVIFEKPLCRSFSALNEFESMLDQRNAVTACGFFNLLNKKFRQLQRLLYTKNICIKQVTLIDGSIGPLREKDICCKQGAENLC